MATKGKAPQMNDVLLKENKKYIFYLQRITGQWALILKQIKIVLFFVPWNALCYIWTIS